MSLITKINGSIYTVQSCSVLHYYYVYIIIIVCIMEERLESKFIKYYGQLACIM